MSLSSGTHILGFGLEYLSPDNNCTYTRYFLPGKCTGCMHNGATKMSGHADRRMNYSKS